MTPTSPPPDAAWTDLARSGILVLDDDVDVRTVVSRCLCNSGYTVHQAGGLDEAREQLAQQDIIIVLADLTLRHGESGLELLAELQDQRADIDVIVMTANSDVSSAVSALKAGAYDYLCKPFAVEVLLAAVERAVDRNRLAERTQLLDHLDTRRQADEDNLEQFLVSLASAIDAKSRYTAQHSKRVSALARILGEAMGLSATRCDLLALGGRLHDIGKIGTPDAILDKPGSLTPAEFDIIREHPAVGDQLVQPIRAIAELRPMIRWHHERLDGNGYPDGLSGDEIPLEALLIKTADIWEAITSRRPYRDPMSVDAAVRAMRAERDVSIPAEIVETFLKAIQGSPFALPASVEGRPSQATETPPPVNQIEFAQRAAIKLQLAPSAPGQVAASAGMAHPPALPGDDRQLGQAGV
ncbi:MAG: two-component system response regulator [Planctomycetota bacterium]|nr:MAG: two-component system response regulator [Planctomycetota bacterium]